MCIQQTQYMHTSGIFRELQATWFSYSTHKLHRPNTLWKQKLHTSKISFAQITVTKHSRTHDRITVTRHSRTYDRITVTRHSSTYDRITVIKHSRTYDRITVTDILEHMTESQ